MQKEAVDGVVIREVDKFESPTDSYFSKKPIERLTVDVPLEARISFADSVNSITEWLPANKIAEIIGKYDRWVYRMVKELEIQPEPRVFNGIELPVYPPYTAAVLTEELAWRESFRSLPIHLSFSEIVELIGRSAGWTRTTLDSVKAQPTRSEKREGKTIDLYPKGVLKVLRRINMAVPLDSGWLNLNQLVDLSGANRDWIVRRLHEAGYQSEFRRSSLSGKVHEYFPPEAIKTIKAVMATRPKPAGEWMTIEAIAAISGKHYRWVDNRLRRHAQEAEVRLDDNGVPRLHFPPRIFSMILQEAKVAQSIPEKGDYLSLSAIADALNRSDKKTIEILEELGISAEPRRDKINRIHQYFPPETVEVAQEFLSRQVGAATVTSTLIAEAIMDHGKVKAQLRAKRKQLRALLRYGHHADQAQIKLLQAEIAGLTRAAKNANQRRYRLENY